jgi:hypothetical protein
MEKGIKRENGAVILTWETQFPSLPAGNKGEERIAAFYRRMEEEAHETAQRLTEAAREEYREAAKERKRVFFPFYRFSVTCTVTENSDRFFSVIRRAILTRGGTQLVNQENADLFWKKTGSLCPRGMLRLLGYRLPKGKGELYIENGSICCMQNTCE